MEDGPHYTALLAEREARGEQILRRLNVYRLPHWSRKTDCRKQRELIFRDWEALSKFRGLPCVAEAEPSSYWQEDQFVVVPYQIPPGRTVKAMRVEGTELSAVQGVQTAVGILRQPGRIHEAGVLHRNLLPNCIYVQRVETEGWRTTFADFDFSRPREAQTFGKAEAKLVPLCPTHRRSAGPA